jgi:hypothetical protein
VTYAFAVKQSHSLVFAVEDDMSETEPSLKAMEISIIEKDPKPATSKTRRGRVRVEWPFHWSSAREIYIMHR